MEATSQVRISEIMVKVSIETKTIMVQVEIPMLDLIETTSMDKIKVRRVIIVRAMATIEVNLITIEVDGAKCYEDLFTNFCILYFKKV